MSTNKTGGIMTPLKVPRLKLTRLLEVAVASVPLDGLGTTSFAVMWFLFLEYLFFTLVFLSRMYRPSRQRLLG